MIFLVKRWRQTVGWTLLLGIFVLAFGWQYSREAGVRKDEDRREVTAASVTTKPQSEAPAADDSQSANSPDLALKQRAPLSLPTIHPTIAATTQQFKPFATAQTHAELLALLESFPTADQRVFRQAVVEPVTQWCSAVWSSYFDEALFQRRSPGRYQAIVELRKFCGIAPAKPNATPDPAIFPLGSALLGFYSRAVERSGAQNRSNLFELGVSLQQRYRSGLAKAPASLGCEFGCSGAFAAATMILACGTVGGCGPRSALALGFCATGFIPEGCRRGADYLTALRDRYSSAEWQRVEWAIGVMAAELQ